MKFKVFENKKIKAGFGYTLGNYLLKGINFLTVPLFTRLMSTSEYGNYNIYMTYVSIVTIFIALALHSSVKNAYYRYDGKIDQYISSILIIPILVLGSLVFISNLFFGELSIKFNKILLSFLLCHSFANSIVEIYNAKLSINYEYKAFLTLSFFNTICNIVTSIFFIGTIFSSNKLFGRILGSALPIFLIALYIYWKSFRLSKPKINFDYWAFGLKYSLPIIPHGLSQIILSSFDRIMIDGLIGSNQAGIYSLAVNVENIIKISITSLDSVWNPWFYEKMHSGEFTKITKFSNIYVYCVFVLIILVTIFSPEIVYILSSPAYYDAKYVVIPLLSCTFFIFLYTLPATVEYYYQKTKMIALGTFLAGIINIILNCIFIPIFGYYAAAYTTLVSYIFYFIFHYLIASRISPVKLFDLKFIILISVTILFFNIICSVFVEVFVLRLFIAIIFVLLNLFYLVKNFRNWREVFNI